MAVALAEVRMMFRCPKYRRRTLAKRALRIFLLGIAVIIPLWKISFLSRHMNAPVVRCRVPLGSRFLFLTFLPGVVVLNVGPIGPVILGDINGVPKSDSPQEVFQGWRNDAASCFEAVSVIVVLHCLFWKEILDGLTLAGC